MSISVQKIGFNPVQKMSFKAKQQENNGYENPINRKTEKRLAVLETVGTSAVIGVVAGGLSSLIKPNKKLNTLIGAAVAIGTLAFNLPSKLYNTKVGAFTREKEMDVFSRQKEAQNTIYEKIDDKSKDPETPVSDTIKDYATMRMADKGQGLLVQNNAQ